MKLGIISDVHANYPALQAVHKEVGEDISTYVFAGDAMGLYGYPSETIDFLQTNTTVGVKGNHDVATLENNEGHVNSDALSEYEYRITSQNLSEKQKNWIRSLQSYDTWEEHNLLVAHAEPYPESATGIDSPGVRKRNFTKIASRLSDKFDFVVLGHTHNQSSLDCSKFGHDVVVVNPGSVGQPIGEAHFSVLDTDSGYVEQCEIDYDSQDVKNRIRNLGTPIEWWR